ncbi:MAG TPA: nodulation protein NodH, partial [Sulfitobacter sp.]|nr:nodulation protein NodH [Sulfitobacter sp.]
RNTLMRRYKMPLPKDGPDAGYDRDAHRTAFVAFLKFLKGNLAGQTSIRVDAAWCSQAQAIAGFGEFCLPDRIIREEDLAAELAALATTQGHATSPGVPAPVEPGPFMLADIYDNEIEALAADAYQKDYMTFGFSRWR